MIKAIYKYYLRFPPLARTAINFSLSGLINYAGIDYRHDPEHLLLECDEVLNKKIFV